MDNIKIPNKVLTVSVTNVANESRWPYDDGSPWWASGSSPVYYSWRVTINITTQTHSSNFTRDPFKYTGLDVFVNDWYANAASGRSYLISEVRSKTDSTVEVILVDKFRYNTFLKSNSTGNEPPVLGAGVIFQLTDEGMPILDPVSSSVSSVFNSNVEGRFRRFNTGRRIELSQLDHGFMVGDIVSATNSGYELTTSGNANRVLGKVVEVSSNPALFSVTTNNKMVSNIEVGFSAGIGDYLYADVGAAGKLSTVVNGPALYLAINDPAESFVIAASNFVSVTAGATMAINGVNVQFTGNTSDISVVMATINNGTADHGVSATAVSSPTVAVASVANMAFGNVYLGTPPPGVATINGVTVTFDSDVAGQGYGVASDAVIDINQAAIPNLVASNSGNIISITNNAGGAIDIVNITPDSFASPIAGPASATGLPLSTPASAGQKIRLSHADGFSIILQNISGTPIQELGLTSVDNGRPVLMVPITEAGVAQTSGTIIVPDLPARDNLSAMPGQQVYVVDNDDGAGNNVGEWALYIWDGSIWTGMANKDSSTTDAKTLEVSLAFDTVSPVVIGTLSDKRRVIQVLVNVITPFDGTATLDIGDEFTSDSLMSNNSIDLSVMGSYTATPSQVYDAGQDIDIIASFVPNGATVGEADIVVTYV